jgi:hypothetical protein
MSDLILYLVEDLYLLLLLLVVDMEGVRPIAEHKMEVLGAQVAEHIMEELEVQEPQDKAIMEVLVEVLEVLLAAAAAVLVQWVEMVVLLLVEQRVLGVMVLHLLLLELLLLMQVAVAVGVVSHHPQDQQVQEEVLLGEHI